MATRQEAKLDHKAKMSMRLLDTSNNKLAPKGANLGGVYAILSHTWGLDEITHDDMLAIERDLNHPLIHTAGYRKIEGACAKAADAGFGYIWIDTCCIYKESNTELSEAINSMYRWYEDADVCFVYLDDVEASLDAVFDGSQRCRWFTRAWCLQELIAPKNVEFCDKNWVSLGSKADMARGIATITGISANVLLGSKAIKSVTVAQRMSWAAGRNSTREEDKAYCLLGIFGISMPLLYGEGAQAFRRLQEQIIAQNNDSSIFAHTTRSQGGRTDKRHRFQGLFAESPLQFRDCRDIAHSPGHIVSSPEFVLTNRGLHFKHLDLCVERTAFMYSLRLHCESPTVDCRWMYLRKVGPSLYAQCTIRPTVSDRYLPVMQVEEAYILADIPPSLHSELERSEEHAIQVRSNTHNLVDALQVVQRSPQSNRWDASGMQFLTRGMEHFGGVWKFFPGLAHDLAAGEMVLGKTTGHVYLVCGLEGSPLRPWVRWHTIDEWRRMEANHGMGAWRHAMILEPREVAAEIAMKATDTARISLRATISLSTKDTVPVYTLMVDVVEEMPLS